MRRWPVLAAAALLACASIGTRAQALDAAAYKDMSLAAADLRPGRTLIWAFATGECGQERWTGAADTAAFAEAQVKRFVAAGVDYMVSTGGEAGIFTCGSDAGMQAFVARYDSPRLRGLDFDIEGKQTPEQIDALVQRAKALQRQRPALRLSFTLATHAGSDGSLRSLNATGERAVESLKRHGLDTAVLNLMVMNYGPADRRWCVLRDGVTTPSCDMGLSAVVAARNVHAKYAWPMKQIALTAMLGENDVAGNVFTPADAEQLVPAARALGLAGVHWWSLDRDQPCAPGSVRVSPLCHSLPGVPAGRFAAILQGP